MISPKMGSFMGRPPGPAPHGPSRPARRGRARSTGTACRTPPAAVALHDKIQSERQKRTTGWTATVESKRLLRVRILVPHLVHRLALLRSDIESARLLDHHDPAPADHP